MEWTYYPSTEDRYTGMIWSVGLSIYNAAEPEREDGMFEEWIFDGQLPAAWADGPEAGAWKGGNFMKGLD